MQPDKLGTFFIKTFGFLINGKGRHKLFVCAGQCCRYHGSCSISGMSFGYSQKGFYGSIHKVMTSAAVNMYIDKSWGDILLVGIYDPVVSLRNICFG